MKDELEDFSKIVRILETHILALENIQRRATSIEDEIAHSSGRLNIHDILSRINAVQDLVDRIEIEVDNLEMRVSSIEHVGFRLRTSGR
ncbi:MAG: hypothetical protein ACW98U_02515 [Candidatus Thorarchaeota archaeon]